MNLDAPLETLGSMGLFMLVGLVLARQGFLDHVASALFSKLVVKVALPLSMFGTMATAFSRDELAALGLGVPMAFASIFLLLALAWPVARVLGIPPERRGVFRAMFALSNTIFIGLPVNMAIFGDDGVPYLLLYYMANTTVFWTFGIRGIQEDGRLARAAVTGLTGTGTGKSGAATEAVAGRAAAPGQEATEQADAAHQAGATGSGLAPVQAGAGHHGLHVRSLHRVFGMVQRFVPLPLAGFLAGLLVILTGVPLPPMVLSTTKLAGKLVTPLSLLVAGASLAQLGGTFRLPDRGLVAVIASRAVLAPLLVLALGAGWLVLSAGGLLPWPGDSAAGQAAFTLLGNPAGQGSAAGSDWLAGMDWLAGPLVHFWAFLVALPPLFQVFAVQAAMPTMTQIVINARLEGADTVWAARGIVWTSIISFLILPVFVVLWGHG